LDAAIDLKEGFRKQGVIDKAVQLVGEVRRSACEIAWDVLRNHHRHARKREVGMSHMIDSMSGGRLLIRARCADETLRYFQAEGERRRVAAGLLGVLAGEGEFAEVE
jgi:hypothetical protein